ncbi:MAG: hypothetical protein ACFE9Q_01450 [Candidatus Hodarchaeota archaeon]
MDHQDLSKEINKKIEDIKKKVLSGELSLLDVELFPIFENLKDSLNIYNIDKYSITYTSAFKLLSQKFEELKIYLSYLDNKDKFINFIKTNPKDFEISELLEDCWMKPFTIKTLSLEFLEYSIERLIADKQDLFSIEPIDKIDIKTNFLLEIFDKKFTEKMDAFFESIKHKLPCSYDEIFDGEEDQIKIFEYFVYLLHLLQLGRLNYQKETNFLYLQEDRIKSE